MHRSCFLLVGPAVFHQCVQLFWTCWWTLHAIPFFNELSHLRSFQFLQGTEVVNEFCDSTSLYYMFCRSIHYLIWFPSVSEGLPHGDPITPHVTFTGELVIVHTFWRVPLQRPFTCGSSLLKKQQTYQHTVFKGDYWQTFPRDITISPMYWIWLNISLRDAIVDTFQDSGMPWKEICKCLL